MDRRHFIKMTGAGLGCSLLSTIGLRAESTAKKPNIILIVADDHGYADFTRLGIHDYIKTPNLDQFVKESMNFSSSYSTSPICNPSRCGIITGRYQQRWGTFWYGGIGIPKDTPTIAEKLKKLNYNTAYFGKLHYGRHDSPDSRSYPTNHGFDECLCAPGGRVHYLHHTDKAVKEYGKAAEQMNVFPMTKNGKKYEYDGFMTAKFSEVALEYIDRNKDKTFFMQIAFNAIHNFNFQLPEKYLKEWDLPPFPDWNPKEISYKKWYKGAIAPALPNGRLYYAAQLYYLDQEFGKLMKKLKDMGISDNTIVIYTSDNGGSTCNCGDNTPLNGTKYTMFEGGIRVPLFIRWPGKIKPGSKCDEIVSSMDFYPTMLAAAGAKSDFYSGSDGENILPAILDGKPIKRDTLHWDGDFQWAVRKGKWKLKVIVDEKRASEPATLQNTNLGKGTELYNLEKDIGEKNNLAKKYPDIVKELVQLHKAWRKEVDVK